MLSDELRLALRSVRYEVAGGTCEPAIWTLFLDRMDEIANRLEAYERSTGPDAAHRLNAANLPEGVVPLRPEPPA